jgi:hypothetical protein
MDSAIAALADIFVIAADALGIFFRALVLAADAAHSPTNPTKHATIPPISMRHVLFPDHFKQVNGNWLRFAAKRKGRE